ncbi:MAG: amidase [Pseudomonadota bacterium]
MTSDLVNPVSARLIADEITAGNMSAEDALTLCRARLNASEPVLNAMTHVPETWQAASGPLSGIAIGIKDVFDTFDMPTRYGSAIYPDHQPTTDAALVTMLRNAGATIAGKTVTTEFAWFSPGPTANPWNTDHTPGGSSSGSAAGVAAGFFPAAIGTQTGGSICRPAAFCGVAGYKPSFRLFPTIGLKHFSWSLDTVGFFAASVSDVAFVAAACSGRDLDCGTAMPSAPRIGVYSGTVDDAMDDDMATAISEAAKLAQTAGATIIHIKGPAEVEAARDAHAPIQDFEAVMALGDEQRRHADGFTPKLSSYLADAAKLTPDDYDNARRTANRARKAAHALFEDCDVLLMPSAPGVAPETLASTGDSVFNRLWTLLGLPAVNVPGTIGRKGLPLGLQIVGPFGKDRRTLECAHWLEKVISQ